ncbi:MAG: type II toxin-antitoxin system HicA family toxin [Rhodospirillales bacterium]|nr:type II toxin-antitoxin system HicA family toxin [Rhodospirillales bacterium]MCB9995411.1 type II toxin-antitoxin system HicA family toxin [Rhodospirillales bacterium]
MASYYRKLIKYLRDHNCAFVREGNGSHEIWYSPHTNINFTVPSGGHCNNRMTVRGICKQAGLPVPDWL